MQDEPEPPRKFYGFKAREFERANATDPARPAGDASPTSGPESPRHPAGPIDIHELVRSGAGPPPGRPRDVARTNEVHDILRENLGRADAAGLNEIKPRKRWSRRRRDYVITLCVVNSLLLVGAAIMPIFGIAGMIFFNLGYTWVTWFVLDDY